MNKTLKLATPLLGVVFLVLMVVSVRMMLSNRFMETDQVKLADRKEHQYAFFLPESESSFFASLKAGALEAAKALDCAVIFHTLSPDSLSFEMASYTGVNGVAVFSYEKSERTMKSLGKLLKKGIPIVQIENEVVSSPRTVLIGTNSYDSGKSFAKIAAGSDKSKLNIALIYSEKNPAIKADASLVEIGMKSILGNRLERLSTAQTTFNPIDAEGVIYELLRRIPAIDIIALTDSNDTLVTIQAIIDLNLVGQVQIIGFGDDQTIKEYIDKGVVLGSIVRNPRQIGYESVVALSEMNTKGNTSAYVNTGITIVTAGNDYRSRGGQSQ
jgi:ribose transport system substrate-binding protein